MLALLCLLAPMVHAGKLADGFRGIPYGNPKPLAVAPMPECIRDPIPQVAWTCQTSVGPVPARVNYYVEYGFYTGISIHAVGLEANQFLFSTLQVAWGAGVPKDIHDRSPLPTWLWEDDLVIATFQYNEVTEEGQVFVFNILWQSMADANKELQVERAASEL